MNRQIKPNAGMSSLLFALLFAATGSAVAGITGTKHDLSTSGGGTIKATNQTEICVFCHTPHAANTNANTPLWNRSISSVASYGVYSNTNSMNTTDITAIAGTDGSASSLCMSCHDGGIAVNAMNNTSNNGLGQAMAGGIVLVTGNANLGSTAGALTNDHPVNFTYNTALVTADAGLVAVATVEGAAYGVKLFGAAGSGKVQCASCHDVHDGTNVPFLRTSMTGSSLCLKCHIK